MSNNSEDFNLDMMDEDYNSEEAYEAGKELVEGGLWVKLEKVGKKLAFTKDIVALYNYMMDPSVTWYRKTIIVAALVYFITPIDAIPDLAPLIGYMDDLGVITAVLKFMGSEIIPYYDN